MKGKIILAVVILLLVLAQVVFGPRKKEESAAPAAAPETHETAPAAADVADGDAAAVAGAAADTPPPLPAPEDVVGVVIGDGDAAIRLRREEDGWLLVGADGSDVSPADGGAVLRLVRGILQGNRRSVPSGDDGATGLEDGGGLPVALELKDGGGYAVFVGLRPSDVYDAAYARLPDGWTGMLDADIRGDLGLWENVPGAVPEASVWLDTRVLSFDPARAVRVEMTFPDHRAVFRKTPEGEWRPEGYVPGDGWSREGLAEWLRDVADFRILDVVPAGVFPADPGEAVQRIDVVLDDGETKSVSVLPNHAGEGMLAVTSDRPGRVFHMPEWRYRRYFHLLPVLFPGAAPYFALSSIRFIDVRNEGESVKIARRDDGWEAVALPYPPKTETVERLARMVSAWRPEDYAAPDAKRTRPAFGGSTLEIILEDGTVRQYRLAGRHPLFPWRYVMLDGKIIFSVTDAEAGLMFPGVADVLDLGRVFRGVSAEDVDTVELSGAEEAGLPSFRRGDDGVWSVHVRDRESPLMPGEYERILGGLLQLRATGFYDAVRSSEAAPPEYEVRLSGRDGLDVRVAFLQPDERDIPFLAGGDTRGYLTDRADFQNWLASVREAGRRVPEEPAGEAAPAGEAEPTKEIEPADEAEDDGGADVSAWGKP